MVNPLSVSLNLLRQSIEPHLQPDEDVIEADFWYGRRGTESAAAAPGVTLRRNGMGVAVTSRRFLVFSLHKVTTDKAQDLMTDLPLTDVDSIEIRDPSHWYQQAEVVLTVRGIEHNLKTKVPSHTKELIEAFRSAKAQVAGASGQAPNAS